VLAAFAIIGAACPGTAYGATLALETNAALFVTGDTLSLTLDLATSAAESVDVYLALLGPGGILIFLEASPSGVPRFVAADPADPATWQPYLADVSLPSGLNLSDIPLFTYTFGGEEPSGPYSWALGLARPGSLVFSGGIVTAPFSVDRPINLLPGTWIGTWRDTIFGVEGDFRADVAVGGSAVTATGTINLEQISFATVSGSAEGSSRGGGIIEFTFAASPFGSGQGTIEGRTVTGHGTTVPFGDFSFTGHVGNGIVDGTFDFAVGGQGVVSAVRQ